MHFNPTQRCSSSTLPTEIKHMAFTYKTWEVTCVKLWIHNLFLIKYPA